MGTSNASGCCRQYSLSCKRFSSACSKVWRTARRPNGCSGDAFSNASTNIRNGSRNSWPPKSSRRVRLHASWQRVSGSRFAISNLSILNPAPIAFTIFSERRWTGLLLRTVNLTSAEELALAARTVAGNAIGFTSDRKGRPMPESRNYTIRPGSNVDFWLQSKPVTSPAIRSDPDSNEKVLSPPTALSNHWCPFGTFAVSLIFLKMGRTSFLLQEHFTLVYSPEVNRKRLSCVISFDPASHVRLVVLAGCSTF